MAKENKKAKPAEKEEKKVTDEKVTKEKVNEEISEVEKLTNDLNEKSNQLLRTLAEYDNFRKRSQKEKEQAYSDSKAAVLSTFLPVIDNFERAANNDNAELEDYKKGVEMIFSQFKKAVSDMGVVSFGESGEDFDPNMHSAVMHIDDESLGENVIAEVFAKGYKLGDKILRPATVKVAN